jgi:hypothetical protein
MTGFRIVWDSNSKIEEREVFEYQRDLASIVPIGGKYHRIKQLVNEGQKDRGSNAVIFAHYFMMKVSIIHMRCC